MNRINDYNRIARIINPCKKPQVATKKDQLYKNLLAQIEDSSTREKALKKVASMLEAKYYRHTKQEYLFEDHIQDFSDEELLFIKNTSPFFQRQIPGNLAKLVNGIKDKGFYDQLLINISNRGKMGVQHLIDGNTILKKVAPVKRVTDSKKLISDKIEVNQAVDDNMQKEGEAAPTKRVTELFSLCKYPSAQQTFLEKCTYSEVLEIADECTLLDLDVATWIVTKLGEEAPVNKFTTLFSSCKHQLCQKEFLKQCTAIQVLEIADKCTLLDLNVAIFIMTKLGAQAPVNKFTELFSSCEFHHWQESFLEKCTEGQVLEIANQCTLVNLDVATWIVTTLREKAPVNKFKELFSLCKDPADQKAFLKECTEGQVLEIANQCTLVNLGVATWIVTTLREKAPVNKFKELFSSCPHSTDKQEFLEKCTENQKVIFQN